MICDCCSHKIQKKSIGERAVVSGVTTSEQIIDGCIPSPIDRRNTIIESMDFATSIPTSRLLHFLQISSVFYRTYDRDKGLLNLGLEHITVKFRNGGKYNKIRWFTSQIDERVKYEIWETATATPKCKQDIMVQLQMKAPNLFDMNFG